MANVAAVTIRAALLAFLIVSSACTSDAPDTVAVTTTASPPTTQAVPTETTATPTDPADLALASRRSDVGADADAFARSVLGERGDISEQTATLLQQSLGIVLERGTDGFAMSAIDVTNTVDGGLIAFIPERDFRGDPELLEQLGLFISGQEFGTPGSVIEIAGRPGVRLDLPEGTWVLWQSHTIVLVAVSESGDFAEQVVAEIAADIDEYAWQTGDCLYMGDGGLPYAPFGTLDLVPCDEPHTHEVLAAESALGAADAEFPDGLAERVAEFCDGAIDRVFGVAPATLAYDLVRYQPDEAEWAAGDRYAACVVARADPAYAIYELVGPVANNETPVVTFAVDECFGLNRRAGQLRCDQPHIFQMVGIVSYPGDSEAPLPSVTDRRQMLGDECDSLASSTVGEPKSSNHRVLGNYDPISRVEWEAGIRDVPCFAYLVDEALAPLTIVGRIDGEHTVLGNTDDSIAA